MRVLRITALLIVILHHAIADMDLQDLQDLQALDQMDNSISQQSGEHLSEDDEILVMSHWVKIVASPPPLVKAKIGRRVEIECQVSGRPTPTIQWLRTSETESKFQVPQSELVLPPGNVEGIGFAIVASRLVWGCFRKCDEGYYTCSALVDGKVVKSNSTLVTLNKIDQGHPESCPNDQRHPPRIFEWNKAVFGINGFDLVLSVKFVGSSPTSIYWLGPFKNIIEYGVSEEGDLTILGLAWSDMGNYTFVVENSEGSDNVTTFVYPSSGF